MKKSFIENSSEQISTNKISWWKKFSQGIMPTFSKLSKAFLLPIALLPIAGVFLGIGSTIMTNVLQYSAGWYVGNVMNQMGSVAFGNLPILFCISVALAYTKDSGVAAITSVVGFLVFNAIQGALLTPVEVRTGDRIQIDHYTMLWWTNISPSLVTANIGISSLNTGVFAAIFVGAISAKLYNKFYQTQLPKMISFFSGTKLVPIITFIAVLPLSFIFMFTWPGIGVGLEWFGTNTGKLPTGVDSLIYEIIERSLIPFGLHHVFYAPLWWTSAGGSIANAVERAIADPDFTGSAFANHDQMVEFFQSQISEQWKTFFAAQGDQTMMYQIIAHPDWLNFRDMQNLGFNLGRFQSGKFAFMMFGLPMAGLAMILNVPKQNRKQVMGIYFSAAFTSFLTGITEPIEYTFLFIAPWLFYGIHIPLATLSFFLTSFMNTHVSMTVSGGALDYIVFGLIPMTKAQTNPLHVLWIGALMMLLYFNSFYFAIYFFNKVKLNKNQQVLGLPGMQVDQEVKLFTKADYKTKQKNIITNLSTLNLTKETWFDEVINSKNEKLIKAAKIIQFLGGPENITDVDACASRLRVTVLDNQKVDLDKIKALGGSTGGIVKGQNIQIVYGGEQEALKPRINEILQTIK